MAFDLLLIKTNYCISVLLESVKTSLNSIGIPFHSNQGCWGVGHNVVFLIYGVKYLSDLLNWKSEQVQITIK